MQKEQNAIARPRPQKNKNHAVKPRKIEQKNLKNMDKHQI